LRLFREQLAIDKYDLVLKMPLGADVFNEPEVAHSEAFFNDDLASQSRGPGKQRDMFYGNRIIQERI
jgi:hypothetical protein